MFRSASSVQEVQLEKPRVGITFPRCSRWPSFRRSAEWKCESLGLHRVSRVFPRNDGQKSVTTLQVYKCSPSGKLKNRTETGKNNVRCHLSAPKFGLTGGVPCFAAEWITKVCSIIFIFFLHRLHLFLHAFGAAAGEITTKPLRQRQTLECQQESTKPGRVGFFFFFSFAVGCLQR